MAAETTSERSTMIACPASGISRTSAFGIVCASHCA